MNGDSGEVDVASDLTPHDDPASPSTWSRRTFLAGTAIAGVAALATGRAAHAAVEPGASYFVPVAPERLCDTRNPRVGIGFRRLDARTIRVGVGGKLAVPVEAVAAVLTVTGVNRNHGGNWLGAYPSGTSYRGTSNSNSDDFDQRVANLVTVKLGRAGGDAYGAVDIKSYAASEVVVDIAGYYLPTSVAVRAGRFEPTEPFRVLDTRETRTRLRAGQAISVNLRGLLPADAQAVVVNLTAVKSAGGGYLTAYPLGGTRPTASCLNYAHNDVRAGAVMVKLGTVSTRFGFDVYSYSATDLVVDVMGYITGASASESADGLFVPVDPLRIYDSRTARRRIWHGGTAKILPASHIRSRGRAVAMNLTVSKTVGEGYFTAYAAQTLRRKVSSLNVTGPGQTVANHVFSRVTSAGVYCYSLGGGHVIADLTGWYTGRPAALQTAPVVDPPPPGGPLPWIVQIPRLGLSQWVFSGDANRVVDAGNTWHWTGTGLVGQGAHVALFGHRTERGGPYRYQHNLRAGDWLHVFTSDGRRYNYQMVAEYITSWRSAEILAATRRVSGETVSVVSCTLTNRLPTSTAYRLISTFRLVGWDDLE